MQKGTPLKEWSTERLTEHEVTTARVFLLTGATLGFLMGVCVFGLIWAISNLVILLQLTRP